MRKQTLLEAAKEALILLDKVPYALREQMPFTDWDITYRLADAIARTELK